MACPYDLVGDLVVCTENAKGPRKSRKPFGELRRERARRTLALRGLENMRLLAVHIHKGIEHEFSLNAPSRRLVPSDERIAVEVQRQKLLDGNLDCCALIVEDAVFFCVLVRNGVVGEQNGHVSKALCRQFV